MIWLFSQAFELRHHRYYFTYDDGEVYLLNPGEAETIALQLAVVLALSAFGLAGWAFYSMFAYLQLHMGSPSNAGTVWLLDSSVMYPAVFAYWAVAWLFSTAIWCGLSLRFADRKPEEDVYRARPNNMLKATKPLHTVAVAVFACAFVGQGFGDVSVCYRGAGVCDFIHFTRT